MIDPALFTLVLRLGRSVMLERERSRERMERKRKEVQSRMAGGGVGVGGRGGGHWGIGELILRLGRGFSWPLSLPLHCHVTSQER